MPPPAVQEHSLLGRNPSTMEQLQGNPSTQSIGMRQCPETEGAGDGEYPKDLGMQMEQNGWERSAGESWIWQCQAVESGFAFWLE